MSEEVSPKETAPEYHHVTIRGYHVTRLPMVRNDHQNIRAVVYVKLSAQAARELVEIVHKQLEKDKALVTFTIDDAEFT